MASPIVKDLGIHRKTANRITKNRHMQTDTRIISTSEMYKEKNEIKIIQFRALEKVCVTTKLFFRSFNKFLPRAWLFESTVDNTMESSGTDLGSLRVAVPSP